MKEVPTVPTTSTYVCSVLQWSTQYLIFRSTANGGKAWFKIISAIVIGILFAASIAIPVGVGIGLHMRTTTTAAATTTTTAGKGKAK
jgi:hypothetical protein